MSEQDFTVTREVDAPRELVHLQCGEETVH
jgi:hypothetical protein